MKAAVLEKGSLTIQEVDMPQPPGCCELQVKLEVTGVCHTDVHLARGDITPTQLKRHLIMGHEGVGIVENVGADVTEQFQAGDRVLVPWLGSTCMKCEMCISGHEALCEQRCATGKDVDGTFAEYMNVHASNVLKLPSSLSPSKAAGLAPIACAGLTAYKALKDSGLRAGQWVGIIGAAGGLGHVCYQYAVAMGFKVIAIDKGDNKVKFLKQIGATNILDVNTTKDLKGAVQGILDKEGALTATHGLHACIVLAPVPEAYSQALELTQPWGAIMCVALPKEPVSFHMQDIVCKGLRIMGSYVGDRQDLREAVQFALDGKVKCVISEQPLDQAAKVLKDLQDNTFEGRAVLRCSGEGIAKGAPTESKTQLRGQYAGSR
jgi:propanol-preferring alcohol dehydrogenase